MPGDLLVGDARFVGFVPYRENSLRGLNSFGAVFIGLKAMDAVPYALRLLENL